MCQNPEWSYNVMIFDYKTKVTLWIYNSNKKQLICAVFLSSNPHYTGPTLEVSQEFVRLQQ